MTNNQQNQKPTEQPAEIKPTENKQPPILPEQQPQPKWRQIIIETDGNSIRINKAEVAGNLEFTSILSGILNKIKIN